MSKAEIAFLVMDSLVDFLSVIFLFILALRYSLSRKSLAGILLMTGLILSITGIIYDYMNNIIILRMVPGNLLQAAISDKSLDLMKKTLPYEEIFSIMAYVGHYLIVTGLFIVLKKLHLKGKALSDA